MYWKSYLYQMVWQNFSYLTVGYCLFDHSSGAFGLQTFWIEMSSHHLVTPLQNFLHDNFCSWNGQIELVAYSVYDIVSGWCISFFRDPFKGPHRCVRIWAHLITLL